jgi:hypothetical protein
MKQSTKQIRSYKFALVLLILVFTILTAVREVEVMRSVQDLKHSVQEQNTKIDTLSALVQLEQTPIYRYKRGGTGTLPYDFETRERGVRVESIHESR